MEDELTTKDARISELADRNEELVADLDDYSTELDRASHKIQELRRNAGVDAGRIRRLRNALLAAGVSEELVAAIEWDR